ncbi:MAG: hypothetical protein WA962_15590 [Ornithinimicrobium sp.]
MTVATQRGESVLAAAQDDLTHAWVALTTYRVVVLSPEGEVQLDRPWHEVDTGAWDPDSAILSLSWVGGTSSLQWRMRTLTGPGRMPAVFRDRVSASVVQVREVKLSPRRTARVSIRAVLSTRELVDQVSFGRGARTADPELVSEVGRVQQEARAEVGLPPSGGASPPL